MSTEPIKIEPGTGGQNDSWPGESGAPAPGTETKDGKETIIIPIVR